MIEKNQFPHLLFELCKIFTPLQTKDQFVTAH